jgi:hypothetical protein
MAGPMRAKRLESNPTDSGSVAGKPPAGLSTGLEKLMAFLLIRSLQLIPPE